ncbi:MAG: PAC2 family protein [Desulfobacteraceae bacterium]|nr:MAG: PAC2 family protein [Desulfobacteraceae bacterium]
MKMAFSTEPASFIFDQYPELKEPILVAGFDGWGNALNVSEGTVNYVIGKLKAEQFARIDPDLFYRYDELRPVVSIENGDLKNFTPPGGSFHFVRFGSNARDLVLLKADEPNLRWFQFTDDLFRLCERFGIDTIITLGSMYDNVLHTDRIISAVATSDNWLQKLREKKLSSVNYQGPSAIHSMINSEARKRSLNGISLWCHCPYYLQGTTHFGLLSELIHLLCVFGNFELSTLELEASWSQLLENIQKLIDGSPELQSAILELRKAKVQGSFAGMKGAAKSDKVINLQDFLNLR